MKVYMGKGRHQHMIQDRIQAKVDYVWSLICSQHNYFNSAQAVISYCEHGRAVCLCHAEAK
jgi:hypothetical protein